MKTIDIMRKINGQEFAVISYTNNGAHAPTITSYPVENLPALKSDWKPVTIADIERLSADRAELLEALRGCVDWLTEFNDNERFEKIIQQANIAIAKAEAA